MSSKAEAALKQVFLLLELLSELQSSQFFLAPALFT